MSWQEPCIWLSIHYQLSKRLHQTGKPSTLFSNSHLLLWGIVLKDGSMQNPALELICTCIPKSFECHWECCCQFLHGASVSNSIGPPSCSQTIMSVAVCFSKTMPLLFCFKEGLSVEFPWRGWPLSHCHISGDQWWPLTSIFPFCVHSM